MSLPWRDLQRTEDPVTPIVPGWAARTVTSRAATTLWVQAQVAELDCTPLSLLQRHHVLREAVFSPCSSCSPYPDCLHPALSKHRGQWTQAAAGAASRATGRYLQQPEGAEALKGQRRDALQGVVAEDPVEGKKEAAQCWGHLCVCCKKPILGCMLPLHQLKL